MLDGTTALTQKVNPLLAIWRNQLLQAFLSDGVTLVSGIFLVIVLTAVLFAPLVSPHKYQEQQIRLRHLAPLSTGTAIIKDTTARDVTEQRYYLLGTDHLGRDMVSRLIHGGRISISVGVLGVLVSGGTDR